MYEYGVVIRRQRRGGAAVWELWVGDGKVHEESGFLAVMNWAGARGFEAFAAGNFDEIGVPEVLLKRSVALPPPPPLPAASERAGGELAARGARPAGKRGGAAAGATAQGASKSASRSASKPAARREPKR